MSKGSKPRPMTVPYQEYVDNWDKIFGEKNELENNKLEKEDEVEDQLSNARQNMVDLTPNKSLDLLFERMKTGHA